jgi:uncharacterized protein YndB with AHSA1/START domain
MPKLVASAEVAARPDDVARVVLDPQLLSKWFYSVKRVEADADWPRVGTTMTFHVGPRGKSLFVGRMLEDRRPDEIVMGVKTPSGGSRITHRFEPLDGGTRCRLTKTVEPQYAGFNRYLSWLLNPMIRMSMRAEVRKVARLAEGLSRAKK